jgi:1-acyl-sn-glycerol-3-phosphate acyltransferase
MLYRLGWVLFRLFFAVCYRWEVEGKEHIPDQGPLVVCPNHIHNLDPPLVGAAMNRKVHFMAKEELFRIPVLAQIISRLGAFPVRRGASDRNAFKKAMQILQEGKVLAIFPEGTRSRSGRLGKAHPGAALIALKGNANVVPAAIIGPYRLFGKIRIVFGPPFRLDCPPDSKINSELLREQSARIMEKIEALLREGQNR